MPPQSPDLAAQLERWQAAGLLSREQAQAIADFEVQAAALPAQRGTPGSRFSAAATLSVIGALVLGLGLIALVAANWGSLPRALKFAGLVALTLASYGAGYALRDRPGASWPGPSWPKTGAALYLLGGVLFGAVLGFLAQGMQLGVDLSTLLALWGAGLLTLAYGVRLPAALHLAVPLGAVIPLLGRYGLGWGWLPGGSAASGLLVLLAGLAALGLSWWHDHRWPTPDKTLGHELGNPWAFWAVPLALGGLGGVLSEVHFPPALAPLPLLLVSLAAWGLFGWGRHESRHAAQQWALLGLGLSLYLLCTGGGNLFWALLGGVLALGLALWGGKANEKRLVNLGLVGVGIAVLSVYFSLFARLLNISLVLVGAGLLLLGLGYALERARRRLSGAGLDAGGEA